MSSLRSRRSPLAEPSQQIKTLKEGSPALAEMATFQSRLEQTDLWPLKPTPFEILQINVGKMCNQTCRHCHVDAGPDRKEVMTQVTMQQCLDALDKAPFKIVDLTGGAPEMNPHFRWFVEELSRRKLQIIVRCNLTIILANEKFKDLPQFFAKHKVQVVSSLPFYQARATDAQRGKGVFADSIEALKMLNQVGYGQPDSGLELNLVFNPAGAFLPPPQARLEQDFKTQLKKDFGIEFNHLYTITNMPIARYLEFLIESGNLDAYMEKLVAAFNPTAAKSVMCRNTLSVGWDGNLFDCDFNQMLDLMVDSDCSHISNFSANVLADRNIVVDQHCFGCTAGSGSSCGGQLA